MILETGDMFSIYDQTDLFCFTANSTIRKDDRLVMGAGMARQVRDRCPGIDEEFAPIIRGQHKVYGLVFVSFNNQLVGAFQTKRDFSKKSSLDWIEYSTTKLFTFIITYKSKRIDLNFPGIGLGGLKQEDVLPIIQYLPDCVHVWERK